MAIRLFVCRDCNHRMRLCGTRCGFCTTRKPAHQRLGTLVAAASVVALGAASTPIPAGAGGARPTAAGLTMLAVPVSLPAAAPAACPAPG